ncbi:MAG: hypothetical protein LBV63_03110 [Candidatus Methanoplasma sp.]|jgi:hypothetical protein|nr:hypothetical protein [Candidatus Methanoplasma sp.]
MHCKDVSVHETDEPLTTDSISDLMAGWRSYVRTEYIILRNGPDHAVVRIEKSPGADLFRTVTDFEIVSLPGDTVFLDDPSIDILNAPAMAEIQNSYPGKTVVIRGMFSHINFVSGMEVEKLRVVDNIPPSPSKLGVLTRTALASGFVDIPIIMEEIDVDISERSDKVRTASVMFPCRVSGITSKLPVYFLDDAPPDAGDVTLVGCKLSKRIFFELYGRDVPFINVCPADGLTDDGTKTIVRCCLVKSGFEIHDNIAKVPWGATVPEIVGAINALFCERSE